MTFRELLHKRRTIRRFTRNEIPYTILTQIVDAGRLAPSGANLQPCEYVIVDEPSLVARVYGHTGWAAYLPPELGPPPEDKRPIAFIIVLFNRERRERTGSHDAAAAIMNMTYAALDFGIGSCWIGSVDREQVKDALAIPGKYDIDSVLALGYPAEEPILEESEESVEYWRDEDGVLHVPKRPLENILYHNKFE